MKIDNIDSQDWITSYCNHLSMNRKNILIVISLSLQHWWLFIFVVKKLVCLIWRSTKEVIFNPSLRHIVSTIYTWVLIRYKRGNLKQSDTEASYVFKNVFFHHAENNAVISTVCPSTHIKCSIPVWASSHRAIGRMGCKKSH